MQQSRGLMPDDIKDLCVAHIVSKEEPMHLIPVIPVDLIPVITSLRFCLSQN